MKTYAKEKKTKIPKPRRPGWIRDSRIRFNAVFIAAAFLISALCVLGGGYVSKGYDLQVGSISGRRIQSTQDVVNETATNALKSQAAEKAHSNVLYGRDNAVTEAVMNKLQVFFDGIEEMRRLHEPVINPAGERTEGVAVADLDRSKLNLDISTTSHLTFLVTCASDVFLSFKETILEITEARMMSGIKEDALYSVSLGVKDELNTLEEWDQVVKNAGYNIISQVLKPNMLIDTDSMEKAAQDAMDAVAPVVISKGQNIVNEGDPITPEIYDILDKLGLVRTTLYERIPPVIGALISVAAVFLAGILFLTTAYKQKLQDRKNVVLLFTLFAFTIILAWVLQGMSFVFVPVILFTMVAAILLDEGLAVGFNITVSIVAAMVCMGDMKFVAFFVISGLFVAVTAKMITERNKMLSVTAMISVFCAVSVCAVYLVVDGGISKDMWDQSVIAALYGIVSVVVCVGVLPLFETVFGFVTPLKLVDLANPNNPLFRRLIIEAPGTYQHSVIVANLAETACYAIGANHTLARIGSYYHDVGKLRYPQYFIENVTTGINPHDSLAPAVSAKIIIEHVEAGVALAEEHKLPKVIRAFIEEHHGRALQKYFYYKAKTAAETTGGEVDEAGFRYGYDIPQSRESAVVTLADSCEAAVRSIIVAGKSAEEIDDYVRKLIKMALDEGRLRDSGLTIGNLDVIAAAFLRVFKGMYHERVVYPAAASTPSPVQRQELTEAPAEDGRGETPEDGKPVEMEPEPDAGAAISGKVEAGSELEPTTTAEAPSEKPGESPKPKARPSRPKPAPNLKKKEP